MGDEALIGRILDDRYVIGERIARGGMASVFTATDTRLDRVVAVKVMHTGLGDDAQFTERFVREARSAAKLNHSNVVAVFDQGFDGDVTYLVMEYVPGKTLRDVMRDEAPMPPGRALALIEQVLIALSAAHAARIIHRDVKPENVLMSTSGEIKVADFGLARAVSSATTATGGTLIGTVSYLAPEIVTNERADARSDVYACGAMLYEMLTGLKPHAGDTPIQVAYRHVHEDVPQPSLTVPQIPPYVDALVARATARNRDQRSADAHVMLQQVRQVQRALDDGVEDDEDLTRDLLPAGASFAGVDDTADTADQSGVRDGVSNYEATSTVDGVDAASTVIVSPGGPAGRAEATMVAQDGLMADGLMTDPTVARLQGGLTPPMGSTAYKRAKKDRPKSRRGPVLLIAILLLAVLAGAGGWYYGVGRYVETPKLVGLSQAAATDQAKSAGFELEISDQAYSETVAKGTIISTDPSPGDKILPGGTISAVVSKGKERYKVPQLTGMSLEDASAALAQLHLTIGKKDGKYDAKIAKGKVISTVLKTGTEVKRDTEIDLYVSKGREPVKVVNYVGKSEKDATAGLKKAGFKVDVKHAFSDDVAKGKVISQDPHDGTKFRGDTITITVSKGREFIAIPDVVGKNAKQAEKILKDAGFKVKRQFNIPGSPIVRSTSPEGKARPGSTITINFIDFG